MRLVSVKVWKYRSIDNATDFKVGNYTVLVGPNNQGKSNLLRAAVLAMEIIEGWSRYPRTAGQEVSTSEILRAARRPYIGRRTVGHTRVGFDWERDFPLFARTRRGAQRSTVIRVGFELSQSEQEEFRTKFGMAINKNLAVKIALKERTLTFTIPKSGTKITKAKSTEIAQYITSRIKLIYIPAVRTDANTIEIVDEILKSRRRQLLSSPEYAELIERLELLDKEVIAEVEDVLKNALPKFIPECRQFSLKYSHSLAHRVLTTSS